MTNAQAVAVASRLHARLTGDGYISLIYDDAPWWVGYYQYFRRAIEGSGLDMPIYLREDVMARMAGEPCTREEFVRLTAYALELAGVTLPEINQVVLRTCCREITWKRWSPVSIGSTTRVSSPAVTCTSPSPGNGP